MEAAIVTIPFPFGELPAAGYRCGECGAESLSGEEVARMQKLGAKLGMHGVEKESTRRLRKTGNSLAVSLDPALLRELLPGAKAGMIVRVGRLGDSIVIRRG